jgi:hypothetical protein
VNFAIVIILNACIDKPLVEDHYTTSRWILTTRYTGDTICARGDENKDASLAVEMGNHNKIGRRMVKWTTAVTSSSKWKRMGK